LPGNSFFVGPFSRRRLVLLLICLLFLAAAGQQAWRRARPDRPPPPAAAAAVAAAGRRAPLRVTFLDVGQGDACVIEGPGSERRVVVVDGGGHPGTDERDGADPGSRVVVPFLRWRGISAVDLLIPTHPDDDHAQGLIAVVDRMRVRAALDGGHAGQSAVYARLRRRLARRGIPVLLGRRGQTIDLGGGARIEVLHPSDAPVAGGRSRSNNQSLVLRIVYGRARLLLTGDAEAEAEADLIASKRDLSADLIKIGHHGSRWSSSERFLDRAAPSVAVISCGRDNPYGHPHPEVLRRLAHRRVRVFRTDRNGALAVETEGDSLRITPTRAAHEKTHPLLLSPSRRGVATTAGAL
jgi:competence protein ComEC